MAELENLLAHPPWADIHGPLIAPCPICNAPIWDLDLHQDPDILEQIHAPLDMRAVIGPLFKRSIYTATPCAHSWTASRGTFNAWTQTMYWEGAHQADTPRGWYPKVHPGLTGLIRAKTGRLGDPVSY